MTTLALPTHVIKPKYKYILACEAERAGAIVLGYTQVSWDDLSGETRQPWAASKSWRAFTDNEKRAAGLLGYTETTWDNDSGSEPQPASAYKYWVDLTACTDGKGMLTILPIVAVGATRSSIRVLPAVCHYVLLS